MKRTIALGSLAAGVAGLIPGAAMAAGGKASDLVVVADTRALKGINLYLATLYNQDMWMFAVWAVVLTTVLGIGLGLIMDQVMKHIGLDLGKSAGHAEH